MTDSTPPSFLEQLGGPWRRTLLTLNELAAHLTVIFGLLAAIKLCQRVIFFANSGAEFEFFKGSSYQFNAQWFFDAADLALLVALLFLGVGLTIWTAIKGEHK
ncbi:MAG: hypothetical protein WBB34_03885 [Xanthobacteraceae bacterium]